jgi:hypothetical protein
LEQVRQFYDFVWRFSHTDAAELKREITSDTIFRYVDARGVGNARQQAGVKVVPLLQVVGMIAILQCKLS